MLEGGKAKKGSIFSQIKDKNLAYLKSATTSFALLKDFCFSVFCCSALFVFLAQINFQTFINSIVLNEAERNIEN